MTLISLSTRADLFHVVRGFADPRVSGWGCVWIDPMRTGGVMLFAGNGVDYIAVPDPRGQVSRRGAITVPSAMTKLAVDLFRRTGTEVLLRAENGLAWIDPDTGQSAARQVDCDARMPDWRKLFMRHACLHLHAPVAMDAAASRALTDAATGLARAAGSDEAFWNLCGGDDGAALAVFPAWPGAVALFGATPARCEQAARAESAWKPDDFFGPAPRVALVESSR